MIPTPTPKPSPTPAIIETVSVATGARESLHRLPFPASVLGARALGSSPAFTSDGALRVLPGFDHARSNSAFTNYGQLRVSFAGAGTDRGLVLADGIPAQDGFGGQVDWAAYPLADLIRAELLRGPGSALYGSGAIAGVLSLQTSSPPTRRRDDDTCLALGIGGHAGKNAYLYAGDALSSKFSTSIALQSASLQYDDLALGYQAPIDRAARSLTRMASLRLRYAPSTSSTFDYAYRGAWDYQQEGRPNYDFWRDLTQHAFAFTHAWQAGQVSVRYYERSTRVTNRADKYPSAPGTLLYTQDVPTHESGIVADWTVANRGSVLDIRAAGRFVNGVSTQFNGTGAFSSGGSGVQTLGDLALQETLLGSRDEIVLGLGASTIDLVKAQLATSATTSPVTPHTDRALSPRLAVRYDLSKYLAFRVSAGTGFRAPYLNELVRGYVIGPVKYLPNPNLAPERSSSIVAGFDWLGASDELSLDATRTFVNDAIDFATMSPGVQMRSNFSRTQTDGTTLVFRHEFSSCSDLTASGTQQRATIASGTARQIGKQLPYVPTALGSVSYNTQIGRTDAGVDIAYSGSTYADDLNLQPLGTALTAGLSVALPLGSNARLQLRADNITDARFLSSIDRYAPPSLLSIQFVWSRRHASRCGRAVAP
ncbi:MAG TPA: TonB-dependent receptor [Candidatus Baltobacteraceae bacterium]|nr:TonB-dependent receptor [Candidatus Baltobacteraceae bacterium]